MQSSPAAPYYLHFAGCFCPRTEQLIYAQDDLGYSDVAFNGGLTTSETGNISALATEGIVLKRHYTHWYCHGQLPCADPSTGIVYSKCLWPKLTFSSRFPHTSIFSFWPPAYTSWRAGLAHRARCGDLTQPSCPASRLMTST